MPTLSKSVQFRGIDNAIKAYENMKIPRWGLFQGSQFLMKYEGRDMNEGADLLQQYLESLDQRSADGNTYTLCIYDTDQKINSATKYDASFNFRLTDNINEHMQTKLSGVMETRISGIEEKLNQLLADPEEEEELTPKDQFFAAIGKVLEHPQIQQLLAQKLVSIIDGVGNTVSGIFKPAQLPTAAIGATKTPGPDVEAENAKLQQAITMLIEVDPQLGTNLLKLAGIAVADPSKYNLMITMLKSM